MDKTALSKDAVTQRILETTQETERLKRELENLIAVGISGTRNPILPSNKINTPLESTNKVQIIKSYESKHSQHIKNLVDGTGLTEKNKNEDQTLSPKKTKRYDVHEAREYIKKQRDKRKEVKSKKSDSKLTADLRKEKLLELQQKASELVKKNIEAKKQRSKSKDRIIPQPTNESVIVGFNRAEKSTKHLDAPVLTTLKNTNPHRDANVGDPSDPNLKSCGLIKGLALAKSKHSSKSLQNLLQPPEPHYISNKESLESRCHESIDKFSTKPTFIKDNNIQQNINTVEIGSGSKIVSQKTSLTRKTAVNKKEINQLQINKETVENDLTSTCQSKSTSQKSNHNVRKSQSLNKMKSAAQSQITIREAGILANANFEGEHPSVKPVEGCKTESQVQNKIQIISNVTLKSANQQNHSKERIPTPEWLKNTPGPSDPFNFINTVKRQLHYVLNEKKPEYVDVGVQGSYQNIILDQKSDERTKKSDLKSFISHKCLNSDGNFSKNLELDKMKSVFDIKDGSTFTNHQFKSDCDSDTSKNIPSISSESGMSLRRNANYVKQPLSVTELKPLKNAPPNLDTKKVDEIKLQKSAKLSSSDEITSKRSVNQPFSLKVPSPDDIERVKKKLFTESDSYSTDFIVTDLSKSRDSWVSSNCAKVSPNRVPFHIKPSAEVNIEKPLDRSFERLSADSDSRNEALVSISEEISQKKSSKSDKFISLYSKLHPSISDSDLKTGEKNIAHLNNSSMSNTELLTKASEKSVKSDGFTKVLEPFDKDCNTTKNESVEEISKKPAPISRTQSSDRYKSFQFISQELSKSESNLQGNKENLECLPLKEPNPSLHLRVKNRKSLNTSIRNSSTKNVSLRTGNRTVEDLNNTNEIHLKFEAEIHLLNDFNQSLKHFSEIEKAFESLRTKNDSETVTKKVLQNRDTQTSVMTRSSTTTVNKRSDLSSSHISTINYSRGSGIHSGLEDNLELSGTSTKSRSEKQRDLHVCETSVKDGSDIGLDLTQDSELKNVLEIAHFEDSEVVNISESNTSLTNYPMMDDLELGNRGLNDENFVMKNFAGMSLRMFDQLIKDEDARIENWKKIVKIREQALLDRTRGELVWLEMQKKQFLETGKLPEASLIKKKQRGILLKHQQEKHEMQRLKQVQKEASAKRKTLLKRERDLIKNQLMSDNMVPKLKTNGHKDRRLSGPLKVIQTTGSVRSEASISNADERKNREIKSITSRTCSVVNITSGPSDNPISDLEPLEMVLVKSKHISAESITSMKQRLLMRERALAKRRKTVEELLQWHRKLLEEERAIENLESKAEKIISKIPNESNEDKPRNTSFMSQAVLDRLLPSQESVSPKTKSRSTELSKNIPVEDNLSDKMVSSTNYSTDFDVDSVQDAIQSANTDDQGSVSSITQLIEDFSKIEDNILNFSLAQKKTPVNDVSEEHLVQSKLITIAAEEECQDESKSEPSSHSTHIPSEIEIRKIAEVEVEERQEDNDNCVIVEEAPSEHSNKSCELNKYLMVIELEQRQNDNENSIIILEESFSEHSSKSSEICNAIVIEKRQDVTKPESAEVIESLCEVDIQNRTESHSSKTIETRLEDKNILSNQNLDDSIIFVVDELETENVPDKSSSNSLRRDAPSASTTAEQYTSSFVDQRPIPENDVQAISVEEEVIGVTKKILENESHGFSLNTQIHEFERLSSSADSSQPRQVDSEIFTIVADERESSSNDQSSVEDPQDMISRIENDQASTQLSPCLNIESLPAPEEQAVSPSTLDDSTTNQVEEIVEQTATIPEYSHQNEEQTTSSQVQTLAQEDTRSNVGEVEGVSNSLHPTGSVLDETPDNISTHPTPSVTEEDIIQSPSTVAAESSENKTDEEKAASLSIRVSESQRETTVGDNRNSSTSSRMLLGGDTVVESAEVSSVSSEDADNLLLEVKVNDIATSSEPSLANQTLSRTAISTSRSSAECLTPADSITSKLSGKETPEIGSEISPSTSNHIPSVQSDLSVQHEDSSVVTTSVTAASSVLSEIPSKSAVSTECRDKSNSDSEKSSKPSMDVKKRIQEILNDASPVSRGDKSPRMQDLCVMTYDLISPTQSPESGSPLEERGKTFSLGNEAEELLRKQLAIEQEIKLLTEQQQKEQTQPFYVREIPNKPPPPYTPPSKTKPYKTTSIIPSSKEEIDQMTEYSAKIIHKAYLSNNLDNTSISDNTLNLIAKNIDKGCYKYVFDICKEIAIEHYSQFVVEAGPSWLRLDKTHVLATSKPLDMKGLKKLMNRKLLELFGFEKQERKKENAIMKWSRKKRDHVDEVLVQEMQAQESSWTNFDKDELIVKDRVTNVIMEMLIKETAQVLKKTAQKKREAQ